MSFDRKEAIAMDSADALLAYMAPQPSMPVTSALAIVAGISLVFGKRVSRFFARTVKRARGVTTEDR
jgi:hypothetical protein